uniref:Global nitrogen transcriptional regulator n=1 Tax=Thaumatella adunca TaxID=2006976 RepID=A0A1Z1MN61_9FLOR|nr:global nitrogen transcriptional regulator [Thaumatella adunca]ARW67527.1 global nitrogen transcriptional regulator [Thaumatella adunca]
MKWIKLFSNHKIPYYVYKLNKSDSIILCKKYNKKHKSLIILYGSIYVVKIFSNQEQIPIVILNKDNIFTNIEKQNKSYYKLIALEKTYIATFQINIFQSRHINHSLTINIIKNYDKTLEKYEIMNEIINQKYLKNRVLQLILSICLQFGIIKNNKVYIPFKLSQDNIAAMTGTTKTTVNKIMKIIYKKKIIEYSNKKTISINYILNLNFK